MAGPFTFFDRAFHKMDEAFAEMDKGFAAMPPGQKPMGCICPPTSEQTCQAPMCPRKPFGSAQ